MGDRIYGNIGGNNPTPTPTTKPQGIVKIISNFIANKQTQPVTEIHKSFTTPVQPVTPKPTIPKVSITNPVPSLLESNAPKKWWEISSALPKTSTGIPITPDYLKELADNTIKIMPKNQVGQIPNLASSMRYGDNLYIDMSRNELTTEPNTNTKQLYETYDTTGAYSWTINPQTVGTSVSDTVVNKPVSLDENSVMGLYSMYQENMSAYNPQRAPTGFPRENPSGTYTLKQLSQIVPQEVLNGLKSTWTVKRDDTFFIIPPQELEKLKNPLLTDEEKDAILKTVRPYSFDVPKSGGKGLSLRIGEIEAALQEPIAAGAERHRPISTVVSDLLSVVVGLVKGSLTHYQANIKSRLLENSEGVSIFKSQGIEDPYKAEVGKADDRVKFLFQKLTDDVGNVASGMEYYDPYSNEMVTPENVKATNSEMVYLNEDKMTKEFAWVGIKAAPLHNEAKRLVALGGVDNYMKAVDTLKDAYNFEFSSYTRDPSFNGTQYYDPTFRDRLFTTMAQIELQHGIPLSRNEIRNLSSDMADPTVDFIWNSVANLGNFAAIPVGGIATGLLEPAFPEVIAGAKALIPGFEHVGLVDGAFKLIWNGLVKPATEWGYDVFHTTAAGKLLIDVWHLDTLLRESSASVARKIGQQADGIARYVLGNDLPRLENVTDAGIKLNKYGDFILGSELTGEELQKAVVNFAIENGDAELADPQIAKKLISFADTVSPSNNGWGKLFANQYDKAVEDLYNHTLTSYKSDAATISQLNKLAEAGDTEAISDLTKLMETKARVFASMNVSSEQIGRRIGGIFHQAFLDSHTAWEGTKILENTLFGWMGNLPGIGEDLRPMLNNWHSGVQAQYNRIFTGLVNNWLYRSGRWLSYNQIENLMTYSLFSTDTSSFDRLFDYFTVAKDVNESSFILADTLPEMRFGFTGELQQEAIRTYMTDHPLGHTTLSWFQRFGTEWQAADATWLAKFAEEGAEPTALDKIGHSISNVFEAWKNAGRSTAGIMETVGRTHVASTLIAENMDLVDDTVRSQTLANAVTTMTKAGMSDDSITAVNDLIDVAWKRSYGDPIKFKNLLDTKSIFGGAPSASFWIPQTVLDKAAPEDLELLRQVNEQWTDHVKELVANNQYVRSQEALTFKASVFEKLDALVKEVMNSEGVVGTSVLSASDGKPAITKVLSDVLDDFETSGYSTEKMVNPELTSFRTHDTQVMLDDITENGLENTIYVKKAEDGSLIPTQQLKKVLIEDNGVPLTGDVKADIQTLQDKLSAPPEIKYASDKAISKILNTNSTVLESAGITVKGRSTQDILQDLHSLVRPDVIDTNSATWTKVISDLDKNIGAYPPEVVSARLWNERTKLIQDGIIPDMEHYLLITNDDEKIRYIQKIAKDELGIDMSDELAMATMRDVQDVRDTGALSPLTKASEYEANQRGQLRALQEQLGKAGDSRSVTLKNVQSSIEDSTDAISKVTDTIYPNRITRTKELILDRTSYEVRTEAEQLAMNMKIGYRNAQGDFIQQTRQAVEQGNPIPNISKLDMYEAAGFRNFVFDKETGDIVSVDIYDPITNTYIDTLGSASTGTNVTKTGDSPIFAELKRALGLQKAEDLNAPFLKVNPYNKNVAPILNPRISDEDLSSMQPKATGYQKIVINPVEGEDIEVTVARERKKFIDAILDHEQWGDRTPRYFVSSILNESNLPKGVTLDTMSPEDIVSELRKVAETRKAEGITELAASQTELANKIQYDITQFNNFINPTDTTIIPPPITLNRLPDDLQTWAMYKYTHAANYERTKDLLNTWFDSIGQEADNGTLLKTYNIAQNNKSTVDSVIQNAVKDMTGMRQSVLYGGTTGGTLLEGAVPKMQSVMKEYTTNITNLDEIAKTVFPFWMFPSRATLAWSRMVIENPQILAFYNRYVRYSRSTQIQAGLVDSKGRPLSSFAGRVPFNILGRDMWVDLSAAAPIRYLFPSMRERAYYDEDNSNKGILENVMDNLSAMSALHGIRWSPYFDIIYRELKQERDPYTGLDAGETAVRTGLEALLPFPIEIIPPSINNWLEQSMRKYAFPGLADLFDVHVSWRDSLVEESIMGELLTNVQNAKTVEEKRTLVRDMQILFTDPNRKQSALWQNHENGIKDNDFYNISFPGFLTGFYPRYFTDDKANLYAVRNHLNLLRDSINHELGSVVFALTPDATDRYNLWSDKRYNTPEGWVWGLRSNLQFVKDPVTGEDITDEQSRLNEISRQTGIDIETEDYFSAMSSAREQMNTEQRMCPIGDKECMSTAYQKYQKTAVQLENQYPNIDSVWTEGLKPLEMKEDHYAAIWWKIIKSTRPQRDMANNESWKDYKKRDEVWLNSLPDLAAQQLPLFQLNMHAWSQKSTTVTPEFFNTLATLTTKEGLDSWDASHDTVIEAIARAYEDLRLSPYLDITDGLSVNQRKVAETQFLQAHPVLTFYEIKDYIHKIYGVDRWTDAEIQQGMTLPDTLMERSQVSPEKQFEQHQTDNEALWNKTWDIMGWASPGGTTKLQDAFVALGGSRDDYQKLFDAAGGAKAIPYFKWDAPGGFPEVASLIEKAAQSINLTAPTGTEVNIRAQAETLNDQFKQLATTKLGAGYEDIVNRYGGMSTSERTTFRKTNPDQYAIISGYYDLKDQFGKQNPIWAQYYNPRSSGGGGYHYYGSSGGGGRGYRRSGGKLVPMGFRSQGDIVSILAGNKLGSGGTPKWLPGNASPVLMARISNHSPLTKADLSYLKKLANNNPENKQAIEEFINYNTQVTVA